VTSAIIIDDEPHCISSLKYDLEQFCPDVDVIDTCASGQAGILSIRKHVPDMIFLDIEMPVMNGLQMLEQLGSDFRSHLIFTTAYDRFAATAFRLSAIDYLLKPIDAGDLQEAINKVKRQLEKDNTGRLHNLQYNFRHSYHEQRVAFPQRDGYDFVDIKDIAYCRADGAYTHITLTNGNRLMLSKTLGEVAAMLPEELFERIHHSTLVNMQMVRQLIKKDGSHLVMNDGTELMISKSRKDQVLQRLGLAR